VRDLLGAWTRRALRRLRTAARREREFDDEMRFHLEMEAAELARSGLAPDAARREARRRFGGALGAREDVRATAPLHRLEALAQDLRLAPRVLWRSPALAASVVLTLALGIGVTAGVFAFVDGLLFRARVSYAPASFVQLAVERRDSLSRATLPGAVSAGDFRAYRETARSLGAVAAWSPVHLTLGRVDPAPTLGLLVSCEFFPVYSAERPLLGRRFLPDECETPGRGAVAVIGEELWRDRFAADPAIVGRPIVLDGKVFTVVGVMPANYAGRLRGPGIWLPYSAQPQFFGGADYVRDDATAWLVVVGRLAPGATRERAAAELRLIAGRLDAAHPGRSTTLRLTDGSTVAEPGAGRAAAWLVPLTMAAVTLPLVLVCANVTLLLLARAAARRRETAVRLALGAGVGRLLRMMLAETLTLAAVAGAASLYLLHAVPALVRHLLFSADTPFYDTTPHAVALAYLAAVTTAAGLVSGWVPASQSLRLRLTDALKDDDAARAGARGRWGATDLLVGVQVAVGTVLVVGAALFFRAERVMASADRGFDTRRTLLLPLGGAAARVADGVRALPNVRAVAFTSALGDDGEAGAGARVTGGGAVRRAARAVVSPEFFATVGVPVVRGRTFGGNAAAPVGLTDVVVSESLARALWPGADPLGRRLDDGDGHSLQVIGVVRDVRPLSGADVGGAQFYTLRPASTTGDLLVARFDGDGEAAARAVNDAVRRLDPDAVPAARTVASIVATQAELFGHFATLVGALGALAIALAAVGIYGVVAFVVSRRTKEMGVRVALGASRARLVGSVMGACARPVAAGLVAGLTLAAGGSVALGEGFRGTPVRIDPADPTSYAAAAALVLAAALAAMGVPALRAAGADPVRALRRD
jgi:predicted permease